MRPGVLRKVSPPPRWEGDGWRSSRRTVGDVVSTRGTCCKGRERKGEVKLDSGTDSMADPVSSVHKVACNRDDL